MGAEGGMEWNKGTTKGQYFFLSLPLTHTLRIFAEFVNVCVLNACVYGAYLLLLLLHFDHPSPIIIIIIRIIFIIIIRIDINSTRARIIKREQENRIKERQPANETKSVLIWVCVNSCPPPPAA